MAHYLCSVPLVKDHGEKLEAGMLCLVIRLGQPPEERSSQGQVLGGCMGRTPGLLHPKNSQAVLGILQTTAHVQSSVTWHRGALRFSLLFFCVFFSVQITRPQFPFLSQPEFSTCEGMER